jgi:hypothetical protein
MADVVRLDSTLHGTAKLSDSYRVAKAPLERSSDYKLGVFGVLSISIQVLFCLGNLHFSLFFNHPSSVLACPAIIRNLPGTPHCEVC